MRQRWVARGEFKNMIRNGTITDDSTVAAYSLLMLHEEPALQSPVNGPIRTAGGAGASQARRSARSGLTEPSKRSSATSTSSRQDTAVFSSSRSRG